MLRMPPRRETPCWFVKPTLGDRESPAPQSGVPSKAVDGVNHLRSHRNEPRAGVRSERTLCQGSAIARPRVFEQRATLPPISPSGAQAFAKS
jgi:hypothetical protein